MAKFRSLLSIMIISGCCHGSIAQAENLYTSNLSKAQLIEKIQKIRKDKTAGTFTRVNPTTLLFEGYIVRGSYAKYLKAIDDKVKILVINSNGGDVYDGVKIGLDLQKRKLTVIVDGAAASSAANYLFLAGKEKIIKNGFVGFHGNAIAANAMTDWAAVKKELIEKYKVTEDYLKIMEKENSEAIAMEKEFYSKAGISQELFNITQTDAKGLQNNLAFGFDFLLPSVKTMNKFGIKDVTGESDISFAEAFGIKVIYY